ncbi:hypothetical protein M9H77_12026 [Catharanthus roseus]|uniref:Uncharacterized protein n=1 Tax=Catharanthus roseus TaxID=4058 RepID=A0ACC0BG96_CATRO|nr:hypothetical protein M9H77_12026 [Catharanthus roseus]
MKAYDLNNLVLGAMQSKRTKTENKCNEPRNRPNPSKPVLDLIEANKKPFPRVFTACIMLQEQKKHKKILKENLQRSKRSLKTTRFYEDEVIKLKTLKTRRMPRDSFIRSLEEIFFKK